ncbi:MAG: hypothetical protein GYA33_12945 [Thermogutta sp.]|nr:hypothetical protein [Thermogutta sp.]
MHCLLIRGRRRTIVRFTRPRTALNSRPFSDAELRHGDLLQIGPVVLEYLDDSHALTGLPFSPPVRDSNATVDPPETGNSRGDSHEWEDELRRREAALVRREGELKSLAEALRLREDELAVRENRLSDKEKQLSEREQECLRLERDNRQAEQELTTRWKRLEQRESDAAAQELELRQWEARIVDREAQLQRDQEELRRRVSEIAARERALSDWEEALRRKEQPIDTPPASAEPVSQPVSAREDVTSERNYRDFFTPTEASLAGDVYGNDGFANLQTNPAVETPGDQDAQFGEPPLISAKWLRWQEDENEEPAQDAAERITSPSKPGTEPTGDPGTSRDSRPADDSAAKEVDSYMQSLLSRLKGRDEMMQASRTSLGVPPSDPITNESCPLKGRKSRPESNAQNRPDDRAAARERPQAAEKSVDFAAMRELAVSASQGAIDRYAQAKIWAAMRGKLAVMATAFGCALLLAIVAWAGRLPQFGVYGIVAAAVALLVYSLQYAILSGRLVVNKKGRPQLAERRISREMFKLQPAEKHPLAIDSKAAPPPEASVPHRPAE